MKVPSSTPAPRRVPQEGSGCLESGANFAIGGLCVGVFAGVFYLIGTDGGKTQLLEAPKVSAPLEPKGKWDPPILVNTESTLEIKPSEPPETEVPKYQGRFRGNDEPNRATMEEIERDLLQRGINIRKDREIEADRRSKNR